MKKTLKNFLSRLQVSRLVLPGHLEPRASVAKKNSLLYRRERSWTTVHALVLHSQQLQEVPRGTSLCTIRSPVSGVSGRKGYLGNTPHTRVCAVREETERDQGEFSVYDIVRGH